MFISTEHEFVFLGVPRTGTTSMYTALKKALPGGIFTGKHDMDIPEEYADYDVIACVRNPYAREVSHYLYRHTQEKNSLEPACRYWTFQQYVEWNLDHNIPPAGYRDSTQSSQLRGSNVTMLLRFENLVDDFNALPVIRKLRIALPMRNVRLGNDPWQPYYNRKLARRVYDWAREDFDNYNYSEGSWNE